jgi:hypothetical protein
MENNGSIITTIPLSSKELNELFSALSKAQSQFEVACFDASNPHFKNKFASYAQLVAATRPALTANGLSVNHKTITDTDGRQYMITKLMHGSGQFDASLVPLRPPEKKGDIQGYGSERSYQMRYSYKEIVGVSCHDGEDDDGEAAVGRKYERGLNTSHDYASGNTMTLDQIKNLEQAISGLGNEQWIRSRILEFNEVGSLAELPASKYMAVFKFIADNGKE